MSGAVVALAGLGCAGCPGYGSVCALRLCPEIPSRGWLFLHGLGASGPQQNTHCFLPFVGNLPQARWLAALAVRAWLVLSFVRLSGRLLHWVQSLIDMLLPCVARQPGPATLALHLPACVHAPESQLSLLFVRPTNSVPNCLA